MSSDPHAIEAALALARRLQTRAGELQTPDEQRQQAELDRMIQSPEDKATLLEMTDQAFRSGAPARAAEQLAHILDVQGIPQFFSPLDRTLLRGFRSFGGFLPGVAMPLVKEKMREETANVVLPAESDHLQGHLDARRTEGVRMNVNFLGEALLGEDEAERRLRSYLAALDDPHIEVVSVKISTIFSQISHVGREATLRALCDRFELLVRAASRRTFEAADGRTRSKLVYLDMEEYRDLDLTTEVFRRTLDRPGLERANAGIVLQAYVPDSFAQQRRLSEWAGRRVHAGGSPVTLRLVKGANLEMERVEASIHGWPLPMFASKRETDANYKRMVQFALEPHHAESVKVGIASHNLFDVAYARVLSQERGVTGAVHFEMLEGMANHQRRALLEETGNVLLYAPACRREAFVNAIGYLVRRLDENTGEANFLRHAFSLSVDSPEWRLLERDFRESFALVPSLSEAPHRTQDRRQPPEPSATRTFCNEPDTDFSLPHHAEWLDGIARRWAPRCGDEAVEVPLVIAGRVETEGAAWHESLDPSRPGTVVARCAIASVEDVDRAVASARNDPDGWRRRSAAERAALLRDAAHELRVARADLLGVALAETGKLFAEGDPEVSEAIDFCRYYATSAEAWEALPGASPRGRGVVAVVPPWNFPIGIPCGGVAAALAAGNRVVLKPAPESVATAWEVASAFWRAGIPRTALQFVFAENESGATRLATHPDVDTVIFTGGTHTARSLLARAPEMRLLAETGGKNATVVTGMADRDLAIKHVVQSAFGHSGQKCSATSLLLLEREVYEDAGFQEALRDATESLRVGSAWVRSTAVGPLIREPGPDLERALKELEPEERWLVRPRVDPHNRQLWSPGIKWDVSPGSFTHTTEFFGPLLAVLPFEGLEEAIELVHRTGYGLTSGLQSLDHREQEQWLERVRAGNLYVNRGTTGAIVLRQPFGGMARSAIGPGIKVGGPNYVAALSRFDEAKGEPAAAGFAPDEADRRLDALAQDGVLPAGDREPLARMSQSFRAAMREEFGADHDAFRLVGQDNLRRYRAAETVRVRVHPEDAPRFVAGCFLAGHATGARIVFSVAPERAHPLASALAAGADAASVGIEEETDRELADALADRRGERLRFAAHERVPEVVRAAAAALGAFVFSEPLHPSGRVELVHWFQEQSVSVDYHRYGNLGRRAGEARGSR